MDPLDEYIQSISAQAEVQEEPSLSLADSLRRVRQQQQQQQQHATENNTTSTSSSSSSSIPRRYAETPLDAVAAMYTSNAHNITATTSSNSSSSSSPSTSSYFSPSRVAQVQQLTVRNRRFVALQRMIETGDRFFSDAAMEERDPVLFHAILGKLIDSATRNAHSVAFEAKWGDERSSNAAGRRGGGGGAAPSTTTTTSSILQPIGVKSSAEDITPQWRAGEATLHDFMHAITFAASGEGIPDDNEDNNTTNAADKNNNALGGKSFGDGGISLSHGLRSMLESAAMRQTHRSSRATANVGNANFANGDEEENNDDEQGENELNEPTTFSSSSSSSSTSSITLQRTMLLRLMAERFLQGGDAEFFDYTAVDTNESLDASRDAENDASEAWFVEEEEEG